MHEFSGQASEPPIRVPAGSFIAPPRAERGTTPESLIAEISARMVKAEPEDLDAEINRSLQDVFLSLDVDRGGLLVVKEDSAVVQLSHAWYAEGVAQVSTEINLTELFPWGYRQIVVRGETLALTRLDDLPAEAALDRQSYLRLGVKSVLTIPLVIGHRVHHLIVVHSLREERAWGNDFIGRLRLLGEIFVSALQRREAELALRCTMERLDLAAASADAGLWELDLESGLFWLTEKTRELFGFAAGTQMTLAMFLDRVDAEDRGLVRHAVEESRRTGSETSVEYRVSTPSGEVRWMNSRGRLQAGNLFTSPRLMGVTLDVTRRKLMEQQLQAQLKEISDLREQLEKENTYLRKEVGGTEERRDFFGTSGCMQAIVAQIEQVAGTGSTVLIQGETGTGKELIAQTIHRLSARGKRVMVKVNCAALPAALVESELFGREKGAFTGALSRQAGRFELADGSTLLLDEVAEMPLETQAKLLRVLQEGEFERLGGTRTIKVDVRVIAASNRDLAEEVEQGRFRRDLYYRLNVFPIHVPPLRQRPEDIPKLVWEFVREFEQRMGKKIRRIAAGDMQALVAHSWPGNIRELRNVIEHAMIVSRGEKLDLHRPAPAGHQSAAPATLEEVERRHIETTLMTTHGQIKGQGGAAQLLGLNPSTLYSRLQKLGIDPHLF